MKKLICLEHNQDKASTAVPGLGGKGSIDIGIATDKKDMELVS